MFLHVICAYVRHIYISSVSMYLVFLTESCIVDVFAAGCDDISAADVASLLKEAIQIGHSPSK